MNRVAVAILTVIGTAGAPAPTSAASVEFYIVLDSTPLDIKLQPQEIETEAVKEFKATGRNPYLGQDKVLAEGEALYQANCRMCHGPHGTGAIGPSLVGDEHPYPRVMTDVGMFEVICGGASGVMPSCSERGMTQDQMLLIIGYVRSLKRS